MIYIILGAAFFVLVMVTMKWASRADPRQVARLVYQIAGLALLAFAAFLMVRGQWFLGLPIGVMSFAMFRKQPPGRGADSAEGRGSRVRTAALEMTLDHDTGIIIGRVLVGTYEGRDLDSLSEADLASLYDELKIDDESRDLLEAYLDGRRPDWREHFEADMTSGEGRAANTGPMTEEEAYEVLGLAPDTSEAEIIAAHRRLMKRVHPDHGGSTFLAAKINAAKTVLLGKHS